MSSLSAKLIERYLRKVQKTTFTVEACEKANYPDEYVMPKNLKLKCDVDVDRFMERNFFILTPKKSTNITMFYLHGGGYVLPFFPPQWKMVDKIANKVGAKVIAFDYPMIPHHTYKETYDIFIPYYKRYIKEHTCEKIIFIGDSAGGALAAGFYLELANENERLPDRTILVSPYLDIAARNPIAATIDDPLLVYDSIKLVPGYWAKDIDDKDYRVSPLFGDLSLFHHTLVITGTRDCLHPDSKTFIEAIKNDPTNNYLIKEGMYHVYPIFPIREAKEAIKLMIEKVIS